MSAQCGLLMNELNSICKRSANHALGGTISNNGLNLCGVEYKTKKIHDHRSFISALSLGIENVLIFIVRFFHIFYCFLFFLSHALF